MDPLAKVRPGQRISGLPAENYNSLVEAAIAERRGRYSGGARTAPFRKSATVGKVYNFSGRDVDRGHVLGLEEPLIGTTSILGQDTTEEFLRQHAFNGHLPTTDHELRYCVTLEPIPAGGIGAAVLAGVAHARILVRDSSTREGEFAFAKPEPGETVLRMNRTCGGRLLWKEGGLDWTGSYQTQEVWATIRLPGSAPCCPTFVGAAVTSGTWTDGTDQLITWDEDYFVYDTDGFWSASNPTEFVIPEAAGAGFYVVGCEVPLQPSNPTADADFRVRAALAVYTDGGASPAYTAYDYFDPYYDSDFGTLSGPEFAYLRPVHPPLYLSVGDRIRVYLSVVETAYMGTHQNPRLWIYRVGCAVGDVFTNHSSEAQQGQAFPSGGATPTPP